MQTYGEAQVVGPVYVNPVIIRVSTTLASNNNIKVTLLPPHCPYCATVPVEADVVVVLVLEVVVLVLDELVVVVVVVEDLVVVEEVVVEDLVVVEEVFVVVVLELPLHVKGRGPGMV